MKLGEICYICSLVTSIVGLVGVVVTAFGLVELRFGFEFTIGIGSVAWLFLIGAWKWHS